MSLSDFIFYDGKFLGITWHAWKVVGWIGNVVFFSRFALQWYATEKQKKVVVPVGFWWLSLVGSLLLLIYSFFQEDSVFIFAYLFTWIPYIRNLVIHYRHKADLQSCACGYESLPAANFCAHCGAKLAAHETEKPTRKTGEL